ncbi:MAG: AAA family ATPase [Oscillospiraceae bacterium]|uniref:AAA family ATPase n=1 Tax=Ruminococcus sp. TaxID=41978 RepID=UPI0025F5419B|nr:AAA family ATPase [Ruminococcus sp.]MBQ9209513.1 AAA family ATPase [Oscillospiraceae bacterium]MBR1431008.1 AAA family ATPase [Ruminococcus sp.]
MLKDISTITIQGAGFDSITSLCLFDSRDGKDKAGNDKRVKGSLLYGRNGTGKSTIAKAFKKAKGESLSTIKEVYFTDKDDNLVTLADDEKKKIFVFDEDYVNSQVKLKEDHLDTIIMLGPSADLQEKIDTAVIQRDSAQIAFETQKTLFSEFQDITNPKSPRKCLINIGNALRGDDAWVGRDSKLRTSAKHNTQVRDDTYKKFISLYPTKTKSELLVEFDEQLKALERAKSGSSIINDNVPSIPECYEQFNDETVIELLARKIEKPELSKR